MNLACNQTGCDLLIKLTVWMDAGLLYADVKDHLNYLPKMLIYMCFFPCAGVNNSFLNVIELKGKICVLVSQPCNLAQG